MVHGALAAAGNAVTALGPCAGPWCDRPAAVYVIGPTLGRSPRLIVIGGDRALELASRPDGTGWEQVRCLDCAAHAVEDVVQRHPVSGGPR